jgi:hypothetical protein
MDLIATTLTLIGDSTIDSSIITVYLSLASKRILQRLYPFDSTQTTLPSEYEYMQCELASRMYLRRGAEGEMSHSENGISRSYGTVNDEDILSQIVPFVQVM